MLLLRDWRQALRTPHVYRVGNSTVRVQHQFIGILFLVLVVPVIFYGYPSLRGIVCSSNNHNDGNADETLFFGGVDRKTYNSTYPITPPVKMDTGITYRIAIISDLDKESKDPTRKNTWYSLFKRGHLFWMPRNNFISVSWDSGETRLRSTIATNGRGMELSELVTFDGRLVTFDDRTGIVHRLEGDVAYPWLILMDGDGKRSKGFKAEWALVKDRSLYVGSMGKEWTTSGGEYEHDDPMWVKVVSAEGATRSVDWTENYKKLRLSVDIKFPGYMIHESGAWSEIRKSWFFLPRRCSRERYNETTDETMSCDVLLTADENFTVTKITRLDKLVPVRGFSSFKFLPGSQDSIIVALKTEEYKGQTATYITAFTINGRILLPDERIMNCKFEGFEFV